jgi:uncharacterized protein
MTDDPATANDLPVEDTCDATPVTVVISRLVRPGKEADYEQWISDVADILKDVGGSEGLAVLRPGQHHGGPEYVLVLRFRDYDAMQRWKRSDVRAMWIARLPDLTIDTGAWQEQSGLETWFTLPGRPTPTGPPPRWKQALLTTAGLLPLLLVTDIVTRPLLGDLPAWLRFLSTTPVLIALMTWVVMPFVTRLAYSWLYPSQEE